MIPEWWAGRDLRASVPRLFLDHFYNSSFIAEYESQMCGFLIGFFSQTRLSEGYIHFVGIHPDFRQQGLGRTLYERFFKLCLSENKTVIRSCTSPVNKQSIKFHQKIGFSIEPGNITIDNIAVTKDYNREGDPKVRFKKEL